MTTREIRAGGVGRPRGPVRLGERRRAAPPPPPL